MRERFGEHLWLDVVSKCDLLGDSPVVFSTEDHSSDHHHLEVERYRRVGPDGAIRVSVMSNLGLTEVSIIPLFILPPLPPHSSIASINLKRNFYFFYCLIIF